MSKKTAKCQFKALDKSLPFEGSEAIDRDCLESFPYEYGHTPSGSAMEIHIETDEFTSVCPFSGLPDFATVMIDYIPDELCLELRSLKYYLLSYRNVGIWYEHLVNRMLEDLVAACKPRSMTVEILCLPRGGLSSTVTATYTAERPKSRSRKEKK
ncbi:MAG: NADPH-dependent 7-cyano-7-deazaguanine reductase QueF [Candidatus Hydrogenedens sp.]|jgi:7-cyano-7-deazaguanine reductase|nr:NADPH-dependent 7-cyano-7-deazaguanine reductase QueF [Candidatus Hydrogenedens sp.]